MATAAWIVLLGIAVVLEVARPDRALGAIGRFLGATRPGRVVLVAMWSFVAWHLLTRYGVAPH